MEYLLYGCDPVHSDPAVELDGGPAPGEGPQQEHDQPQGLSEGQDQGGPRGRWVDRTPAGYYLQGVSHGEPAGRWLGSGMAGLGLSMRPGQVADPDTLRAIFGELRYPSSERAGSTSDTPIHLGNKPRTFKTLSERVDAAMKAEPDATLERQREIEIEAAQKARSATAYYDVTFSPVKSVSVYYAALLAAGDTETAGQLRDAHNHAVKVAIESAETDLAWTRTGRHGRATESGRTVGEWQRATGLVAVQFAHHTNRDGEPQLHVHVAVLNRVALPDGRVFALDGQAFRPIKDAMATAYDRAFEALAAESVGLVFTTRPDGKAREVAGIDPALLEEASTRTRQAVGPRVEELVDEYRDRHGRDPGPRARRAIADRAVKQTRQPKTGPAGPAAVAAWIDREPARRGRLQDALDAVDTAVLQAGMGGRVAPIPSGYDLATGQRVANAQVASATGLPTAGRGTGTAAEGVAGGHDGADISGRGAAGSEQDAAVAAREELGAQAVAAGLLDVQTRYATWTVGNLVAAIDRHLGDDAAAVGLGVDDRRDWLRALAERALDPAHGHGVVQVSAGDPAPVPPELRREVDGRSRFRPHIDERYATAEHLAVDERVAAAATAGGARSLDADAVARAAGDARTAGLSSDQVAALVGVLSSPRRVEVLIGPAGAGKSHTLAQLAQEWAGEHGGRVIGTAASEIATRNLAGLGMDAINTHRLLTALAPDEHGHIRLRLGERDLVVVDEAGMAPTADLDALLTAVRRAGAKMVWAGDHHQLAAVDAGGMFAHLAAQPGAIELEQVHRFTQEWEREASLQLREGDPTVAARYVDEGRLRLGTLEQMEYHAGRDYLADRLAGVSSLLIVGSNTHAADLSRDVRDQLIDLGMVEPMPLVRLKDRTHVSAGDLIQARENDRQLRVDGGVDEDGRPRPGLPVTNRELYTVIGYDQQAGELLARDERGAVAHLPKDYVREHVALAYAVTNHSAQGVTVQRGRHIADRDATRESFYPAMTRGREYNVGYLVTEVEPDPHDPQPVRDTAEARLVQLLERIGADDAAITVRDTAARDLSSLHTLGDYYDRVAGERGHHRHAALVAEHLGSAVYGDPAFGALLGRLRAAELGGHDVPDMLREALEQRELTTARSDAQVLHWRVGKLLEDRAPEYTADEVVERRATAVRPAWEQLAAQHRDRATATGDRVEAFLAEVAGQAHERTEELGAATSADPPAWAVEWLGPVPDPETDPDGHRQWKADAGQVAAYREYRGVPDTQVSIGTAPPPAQQLAHELWTRAAAVGAGDPRAVDWRQASDTALREAVERWEREQAWSPPQVAAERGDALSLAHDASNDAVLGRARLDTVALDDPGRERLEARVRADEVMAEQARGFAASLDAGHAARAAWWEQTTPQREAAAGARAELDRRAPAPEPVVAPHQVPGHPGTEGESDQPGKRGQRGEQQALPLDLDPQADRDHDVGDTARSTPDPEAGQRRFDDGIAGARQRGLAEVDPDGRLTRSERDAALREHTSEQLHAELRNQHGVRLDPDHQLSDHQLARARARELRELDRPDPPALERPGHPDRDGPDNEATSPTEPDRPASQVETTWSPEPTPRLKARPDVEPEPEPAATREPVRDHAERQLSDGFPVHPGDPDLDQGRSPTQEEPGVEQEPGPSEGEPTAEQDAPSKDTSTAHGRDEGHEELRDLRRAGHEARLARTERKNTPPMLTSEPAWSTSLTEFDRDAVLDDDVAQRRAPGLVWQTPEHQRARDRQLGRRRDDGPELD